MKLITFILILSVCNLSAQVLPTPTLPGKNDGSDLTTGMRFSPKQKSLVTGLRYFRDGNFTGSSVGHLWDASGKMLASATFTSGTGWITVNFISPIVVDSAKEYIASFSNDGGFYCEIPNFFPKDYPLFKAVTSHFTWFRNSYPTLHYQQTNYSIEPIINIIAVHPIEPPTPIIRDTIIIIRDTCSIDYSKLNDLTFVLVLNEEGGAVLLPDSTKVYQAIYGAAQPHITMKDTAPRMYRFTRTYVVNGKSQSVRFTLYKSGAWIREIKNAAGIYEPWNYAPY